MIRTLLIDDEVHALDTLRIVLEENFPEIEICGMASSAMEGVKLINKTQPDLLFLDISLRVDSGFDVLESIEKKNMQVVFTTAHQEYAIKAIRFGALDYLLKPIDISDLEKAIEKVKTQLVTPKDGMEAKDKLEVPIKNGQIYITIKDILYIKADASYSIVYLKNEKPVLVSRKLKEFEASLVGHSFIRAHNSHLVNLEHIKEFNRSDGSFLIMCDDVRLNVSRSYRDSVADAIKRTVTTL